MKKTAISVATVFLIFGGIANAQNVNPTSDFIDCLKQQSKKFISSGEPANTVVDAAFGVCENEEARLKSDYDSHVLSQGYRPSDPDFQQVYRENIASIRRMILSYVVGLRSK